MGGREEGEILAKLPLPWGGRRGIQYRKDGERLISAHFFRAGGTEHLSDGRGTDQEDPPGVKWCLNRSRGMIFSLSGVYFTLRNVYVFTNCQSSVRGNPSLS